MSIGKKMAVSVGALALAIAIYVYISRPVALVAKVTSGTAYKAVPGSVIVQAEFEMELKSEVGGRVVKNDLDPGQHVEAGAVLAQLDAGDLVLEIEGIRDKYQADKSRIAVGSAILLELQSAKETLENYERLTKSGNYPEAELIKQRRLVKQIEQRLELENVNNRQLIDSYENTLKVKQRQLEKMTIVAPFDGQVSEVKARPGDLIGANSPIAKLISTSRTVEAKISEENFADLKVGQKASVRFLPYGVWLYDATITKILPTSDPETQRYVVHLDVKIPPEKLVPGITGEVSIVVGERKAAANVPRRALFGNNLYVVKDGRVEQRTVELGYTSSTTVEVLKGVAEGEEVIVDEIDRFRDGDRVRAKLVEKE
ncbi:MAG: efflux RND transporter periplasmic adaptor subunit [Opitutaceae bacterium]|nr:efflux RND transporter periplasmic adaptor subunit [Opitutaceae bacterium]MBP9913678.1 efflux RND transporter periplasmic adaptor subunit [Opitutaceae bacterium]